jgi:hypothetical protein
MLALKLPTKIQLYSRPPITKWSKITHSGLKSLFGAGDVGGYNILILGYTKCIFLLNKEINLYFLLPMGRIIWTLLSRQIGVATTTKPRLGHLALA